MLDFSFGSTITAENENETSQTLSTLLSPVSPRLLCLEQKAVIISLLLSIFFFYTYRIESAPKI